MCICEFVCVPSISVSSMCMKANQQVQAASLTCIDDQAVADVCIADCAAPQQHVVEVKRVLFIPPVHGALELIQPIVWLLTYDHSWKER